MTKNTRIIPFTDFKEHDNKIKTNLKLNWNLNKLTTYFQSKHFEVLGTRRYGIQDTGQIEMQKYMLPCTFQLQSLQKQKIWQSWCFLNIHLIFLNIHPLSNAKPVGKKFYSRIVAKEIGL